MRSSVEWRAAHVDETQPSSVTLRLSPDWSVSRRTIAYLVSSRLDYRTLFATDADTVSIACAERVGGRDTVVHDDHRISRPEHGSKCCHRERRERHANRRPVYSTGPRKVSAEVSVSFGAFVSATGLRLVGYIYSGLTKPQSHTWYPSCTTTDNDRTRVIELQVAAAHKLRAAG